MSTTTTRHNAGVAREMAAVAAKEAVVPTDAWVHGFAVGIALALSYPNTARDLRGEIERAAARVAKRTPEEVEVYLRDVSDLFDRSLDQ